MKSGPIMSTEQRAVWKKAFRSLGRALMGLNNYCPYCRVKLVKVFGSGPGRPTVCRSCGRSLPSAA